MPSPEVAVAQCMSMQCRDHHGFMIGSDLAASQGLELLHPGWNEGPVTASLNLLESLGPVGGFMNSLYTRIAALKHCFHIRTLRCDSGTGLAARCLAYTCALCRNPCLNVDMHLKTLHQSLVEGSREHDA